MLAGAKAQPGIESHNALSRASWLPAPAGPDEKSRSYLDRLEMPFPGGRPIFTPDPLKPKLRPARIKPRSCDQFQLLLDLLLFPFQLRPRRPRIHRDHA